MKNDAHSPWELEAGKKIGPHTVVIGETLHWDGNDTIYRQQSSPQTKSTFAITHAVPRLPLLSTGEAECVGIRSLQPQFFSCVNVGHPVLPRRTSAKIWKKLAALATFLLDPLLLGCRPRDINFEARGELIWATQEERSHTDTRPAHPVLIISPLSRRKQIQRIEIIPHFQADDPLLHHFVLVLQAERAAESAANVCYAEALTNALAVHFLKRYAAVNPSQGAVSSGLPPHKLQRVTAYIDEHLEHALSLAKIAAVTRMSVAHFARLFRQDTGMTPHQFIIWRRIERARQLLVSTDFSLCEIGNQVGFTDQSHFIAVFRKHVGPTPRLYRRTASGAPEKV